MEWRPTRERNGSGERAVLARHRVIFGDCRKSVRTPHKLNPTNQVEVVLTHSLTLARHVFHLLRRPRMVFLHAAMESGAGLALSRNAEPRMVVPSPPC